MAHAAILARSTQRRSRQDLVDADETFELTSRGGYARTVTGTVAYLDEEAQTYLVLVDGELERVPLRDIVTRDGTARHVVASRNDRNDRQGLGTGS
jgi:hypothetical protein